MLTHLKPNSAKKNVFFIFFGQDAKSMKMRIMNTRMFIFCHSSFNFYSYQQDSGTGDDDLSAINSPKIK